MINFNPYELTKMKYLFFTGKGGVGKTSVACATAVSLADRVRRVLLVSTDPASNLQDVFAIELSNRAILIPSVPNLSVVNLNPIQAAAEYRESVITPYLGILPEEVIANMEEQLSGSCTVEIAAFNEFSNYITDEAIQMEYDHIIFDTAPTGHTLRMLQLPSAWSSFISESTHGASCLGQLAGLEDRKAVYQEAVNNLADGGKTTLILVARPEETPLKEAARASLELAELGLTHQILIINGVFPEYTDTISRGFYRKQQRAMQQIPESLKRLETYGIPLRTYNITGVENVRAMLRKEQNPVFAQYDANSNVTTDMGFQKECNTVDGEKNDVIHAKGLEDIVDDLEKNQRRVIFAMGKGGVGKTTVAAAIAMELAKRGKKVHLATTDPAAHLNFVLDETENIIMSHIDEQAELEKYQQEVLTKAFDGGISQEDMEYIREDLRSPCTQEIAVFRAFAEIVETADAQIVVIDTAPTGHTLLLLESTESYDREIRRTKGETPESVKRLLPRLKSGETEVVIVTLPEATPVYEALRLEEDLKRAGISSNWWAMNQSLYLAKPTNALLKVRAANEVEWIQKINQHTGGKFALLAWSAEQMKDDRLLEL